MTYDNAKHWYRQERPLYEAFANKLKNLTQEILDNQKINYWMVQARAKSLESFEEKMRRKSYTNPEEMEDLTGIRIIGYVLSDVDIISEILSDNFDIDNEKAEDKSDTLGTNKVGYRSRHFIATLSKPRISLPEFKKFDGISFEIQVRTVLQHAWAEIEHDRNYKYSGILPKEIQREFNLLAGLLEITDGHFDKLSEKIEEYSNEVSERTKAGEFDIFINSTSVNKYLAEKLGDSINTNLVKAQSEHMIEELISMEIKKLSDLNRIMPKNIKEVTNRNPGQNSLSIIRLILIATNPKKYFNEAWKKHFSLFDEGFLKALSELGMSTENLRRQIPFPTKNLADHSMAVYF
jgi:ppGpp synthetase/RelA/SpoT-type nucleotidyltranferase